MLNANIKIDKKETMDFKPLPENIYQVELLDINSEERATYDTRNKPDSEKEYETVMSFQFTLLAGKDGEEDLRGRNVWANFIPTYLYISKKNGKNQLYRIVEALLARDLTPQEEAEGIDGDFLNKLVGKQCRIGVKHKQSGDKIFDNIETYYAIEDEKTSLTDEEKEKATVKKDKEEKVTETELTEDEIEELANVPF